MNGEANRAFAARQPLAEQVPAGASVAVAR